MMISIMINFRYTVYIFWQIHHLYAYTYCTYVCICMGLLTPCDETASATWQSCKVLGSLKTKWGRCLGCWVTHLSRVILLLTYSTLSHIVEMGPILQYVCVCYVSFFENFLNVLEPLVVLVLLVRVWPPVVVVVVGAVVILPHVVRAPVARRQLRNVPPAKITFV